MKQKILLTSLGAAGLATIFGIGAVWGQGVGYGHGAEGAFITTVRLYQLAGISGLFGIASFFVGLAYPVTSTVTNVGGDGEMTSTTRVVNN